jgi:Zn-dependent M28 family amino/carboxypeptidase
VVVAAHLDHVGVGPEVNGDRIYNGAIDNAGGVAVMLEAARSMAAGPRPRRSVIFIATTGEERGLLGSDYYATYPTVPMAQIAAAISVDGLMTFHDFGGIVALGADHSTLGEVSEAAARAIGAVHAPDPIPDRGNLALSDQYPFLRHGVPVLFPNPARGMPRSGPDGLAAWDDYEARSYHLPSDDMNLPIRWDMAERWGRYIHGVIAGAADAPQRPAWYAGDALGDAFDPDGARAARPGGSGVGRSAGGGDSAAHGHP